MGGTRREQTSTKNGRLNWFLLNVTLEHNIYMTAWAPENDVKTVRKEAHPIYKRGLLTCEKAAFGDLSISNADLGLC